MLSENGTFFYAHPTTYPVKVNIKEIVYDKAEVSRVERTL